MIRGVIQIFIMCLILWGAGVLTGYGLTSVLEEQPTRENIYIDFGDLSMTVTPDQEPRDVYLVVDPEGNLIEVDKETWDLLNGD